jgi:hypothetical protein
LLAGIRRRLTYANVMATIVAPVTSARKTDPRLALALEKVLRVSQTLLVSRTIGTEAIDLPAKDASARGWEIESGERVKEPMRHQDVDP